VRSVPFFKDAEDLEEAEADPQSSLAKTLFTLDIKFRVSFAKDDVEELVKDRD